MKRNEDGDTRPSLEEPEVGFSDLGEVPISRARAIKLAGAALAGSALSLFWATDEADARRRRRRRKKRRRRRRRARVNPNPVPLIPGTAVTPLVPGAPNVLQITNPSDRPLTISGVQVLDSNGTPLFDALARDVTIAPNDTRLVALTVAPGFEDELVDASSLRLLDGDNRPINVVNGPITVDLDPL